MTTRTVTMSHSELDRFGVITRVRERRLTQVEAARILDLGVRQVQRLCAAVALQGAGGLIAAGCVDAPANVQPSVRPEFGDYQANGVMTAAKIRRMNPRTLAQGGVEQLDLTG